MGIRTYWAVSLLLVSGMAFAQPGAPGTIDGTVKDVAQGIVWIEKSRA